MALLKLISGLLSIDTGKFLAYASSQNTQREGGSELEKSVLPERLRR